MHNDADLLLTGGRIATLHPAFPETDALAVKDGRIAALGAAAQAMRSSHTTVLDLHGGLALPGFVDAHIHLLWYGLGLEQVTLTEVADYAEVEGRISERVDHTPPGSWMTGSGWNQDLWDRVQPDRRLLDRLSTAHPMLFTRKDGHSIWVNSAALAAAGITAIHDMEAADARAAFQRALASDQLTLRVQMMVDLVSWRAGWPREQGSNSGPSLLQTASLKIFSDGALGSRTAAMLEPFTDTNNYGVAITSLAELTNLIAGAVRQNLACAIHAIGDAANRTVLDAFAATREQWAPRGLRQRIEHVQLLHPDDLPRLAQLGIIASMQPVHATADMAIADCYWGDRSRLGYAWRSVIDSGAALAFGSDCPVETLDVLQGLYAAVTRRRADGDPAGGWYPEQRITLPEALRAYTFGAAYAAGREVELGSLAPGKLADITVLDRDILSLPPEALLEAAVRATIVGGRVVYDAARG